MTSQAIISDVGVAEGPLPDSPTSWSGDVASQPWSRVPSPGPRSPFRSVYSSAMGGVRRGPLQQAGRVTLTPCPSHLSLPGPAGGALSVRELETALRKRFSRADGVLKAVSVYRLCRRHPSVAGVLLPRLQQVSALLRLVHLQGRAVWPRESILS